MDMFDEMDEALRSIDRIEDKVRTTPGDTNNPWDIVGRFGRILTGKTPSDNFTLDL